MILLVTNLRVAGQHCTVGLGTHTGGLRGTYLFVAVSASNNGTRARQLVGSYVRHHQHQYATLRHATRTHIRIKGVKSGVPTGNITHSFKLIEIKKKKLQPYVYILKKISHLIVSLGRFLFPVFVLKESRKFPD